MKHGIIISAFLILTLSVSAQKDTVGNSEPDTIKVGNFIIIKKQERGNKENNSLSYYSYDKAGKTTFKKFKRGKNNLVSTNWWIFDLGFTNVRDNTNYTAAQNMGYLKIINGNTINQNSFALNTGKSSNANIWVFMQKLNIVKHVLNLKYGMGLEMYNFRYDHSLSYRNEPAPYVFEDSISFSKDKLYAGYLTIPMMLNINTSPHKKNGFSISGGVSAGYLLGAHNKQISAERGKQKYHGELGLQPWRLAAISELGLGPVRLYGSYSLNALHKENTGLEQFPYAVGIRFSNW